AAGWSRTRPQNPVATSRIRRSRRARCRGLRTRESSSGGGPVTESPWGGEESRWVTHGVPWEEPGGARRGRAASASVPGEVDGEDLERSGAARRLDLRLVADRLPDESPRDW